MPDGDDHAAIPREHTVEMLLPLDLPARRRIHEADIERNQHRAQPREKGEGAPPLKLAGRAHRSALERRSLDAARALLIAEPVQMRDEEAHMRIVDRALRRRLPGFMRLFIAGEDADDLDLLGVAKDRPLRIDELAAKDQVQLRHGLSISFRNSAQTDLR